MDHATIEAHSLIERYHRGDLPPEEEAAFEEHYFACSQCQQELELARDFRDGLRRVAAEDAARAAIQVGLLAWLARQGRLARLGLLAAAGLMLVALPSAFFLRQNQALRTAAAEARAASEDWRRRFESEHQAATNAEERLTAGEGRWAQERSALEARLEELAAAAGRRAAELARPLVNTPVFLLSAFRGELGEPAATVDLSRVGDSLALAVDVPVDPRFESFRLTVTDAGGERRFRRAGLQPNALEAVMVTFPGDFFRPGDYRLTVEGLSTDGAAQELASYRFRVTEGS